MPARTTFEHILGGASILLIDLLAQIVNLIVAVEKEIKNIGKDKVEPLERGLRGSPISARALKSSIVILQFSVLEALANFLAELIVNVHVGIEGAPKVTNPLSQLELNLLKEQRSFLDINSGEVKVRQAVFISTLDKLSVVPLLFAKSYGQSFKLDKGNSGWNKIRKLKELRDSLTHIRLDLTPSIIANYTELDLDMVRPSVMITSQELFTGSEAIIWYSQEIKKVFAQIAVKEYEDIVKLIMNVKFLSYMHLINLRDSCGITEKNFSKMYPMPNIKRRNSVT